MNRLLYILILLLLNVPDVWAQQHFTDVTKAAGIDHRFRVFEGTFGGGACVFDANNDGWDDLYIAGGMNDDALYLNNRNGTFRNAYAQAGLRTRTKYVTQGAVSADVNRDGWRDLFITTITTTTNKTGIPRATNLLFLNRGNGTFRNATHEYGLDKFLTFSTGAIFGDVNLDGYPDLYVGNYFEQFDGKLHIMNDAMIVGSKQMAKGLLLINQQGKSFADGYEAYGLKHKGFGFGGVFTDFDNDGDLDLLVNHDFGYKSIPNKFLVNMYPAKWLLEQSDTLNMALPINAMGTAVGDVNNDGLMDYYVTNIRANPFMVSGGPGKPFTNRNGELGTQYNMIRTKEGGVMPVSWGANFADFDLDGDLDLFVANGSLNPYVTPNPDYYFENSNGHFTEKGEAVGLADAGISRGSVVLDYDRDGDLDLLVVNQIPVSDGFPTASPTLLYRNDAPKGNWLTVSLVGLESDRNGLGARVEVVMGGRRMIREIDGGSSHLSQNAAAAHFGLGGILPSGTSSGTSVVVDSVIVRWLGGHTQVLLRQRANQRLTIRETPRPRRWYANGWLWATLLAAAGVLGWRRYVHFAKNSKPVSSSFHADYQPN
jgi:enediyne biosynthesis protein E4